MDQLLQNKLFARFPLFFRLRNKGPSYSPMVYGITCGDGWYDLIYLMCVGLEERLKINKFKQNYLLFKYYLGQCGETATRFFISKTALSLDEQEKRTCRLSLRIKARIHLVLLDLENRYYDLGFSFTQIKEKFGLVRVYFHCNNLIYKEVEPWIHFIENISSHVCEDCGKSGEIRRNGWIVVLCDECQNKRGKKK